MPFRRPTFESKGGRLFRPIAAPVDNIVIRKVVRSGLPLDSDGFQFCVVPNQRPKIFRVDVAKSLQPGGYALRLAALKPLRQPIEQVVVRIEMSLRMSSRILLAFVRAREWPFEHIAKI